MIKSAEIWYVQFLHSLPHFDLRFNPVESTFNPLDIKYLQSILFWAIVPALWLLLTILIYVIYCLARNCKKRSKKTEKTVCVTVSVCFIVLLAGGAIGVGLYGNEDMTKNIKSLFKVLDSVFEILDNIQKEIRNLQDILNNILTLGLKPPDGKSGGLLGLGLDLSVVTDAVFGLVKKIQEMVMSMLEFLLFDLGPLKLITGVYEFIRWLVMLIVFVFLAIVCVMAIVAIGSTSRILILLFSIFAIIGLILCGLLTSVHLALTVTVSDLCTSPTAFVIDMLPTPIEKQLITYILECPPDSPNPLNTTVQVVMALVKPVTKTLQTTLGLIGKLGLSKLLAPVTNLIDSVDDVVNMLVRIVTMLQCKLISELYQNVLFLVCNLVLSGTVFVLFSCCLTGLLLSVLILLGLRACSCAGCCSCCPGSPETEDKRELTESAPSAIRPKYVACVEAKEKKEL